MNAAGGVRRTAAGDLGLDSARPRHVLAPPRGRARSTARRRDRPVPPRPLERRVRRPGPGRASANATTARRARRSEVLLFAYGTLMRGDVRHRHLGPAAVFVGEARVTGTLLDLRAYPGLVEGTGRVRGELFRLDDPQVLPAVDREEGYNFERRLSAVTRADGRRARAWIYWYRGPRGRGRILAEGDWRHRWR